MVVDPWGHVLEKKKKVCAKLNNTKMCGNTTQLVAKWGNFHTTLGLLALEAVDWRGNLILVVPSDTRYHQLASVDVAGWSCCCCCCFVGGCRRHRLIRAMLEEEMKLFESGEVELAVRKGTVVIRGVKNGRCGEPLQPGWGRTWQRGNLGLMWSTTSACRRIFFFANGISLRSVVFSASWIITSFGSVREVIDSVVWKWKEIGYVIH